MNNFSQTFETGLSDRHKFISSVAKSGSFKKGSQEELYRCYRSFNIENFPQTLSEKLSSLKSKCYGEFERYFLTVYNKQTLFKTKFLSNNNSLLMTKELRKAIMKRPKLKK